MFVLLTASGKFQMLKGRPIVCTRWKDALSWLSPGCYIASVMTFGMRPLAHRGSIKDGCRVEVAKP